MSAAVAGGLGSGKLRDKPLNGEWHKHRREAREVVREARRRGREPFTSQSAQTCGPGCGSPRLQPARRAAEA